MNMILAMLFQMIGSALIGGAYALARFNGYESRGVIMVCVASGFVMLSLFFAIKELIKRKRKKQ